MYIYYVYIERDRNIEYRGSYTYYVFIIHQIGAQLCLCNLHAVDVMQTKKLELKNI